MMFNDDKPGPAKALFWLFIGLLCILMTGCMETLYSNITEDAVNDMMAILIRHDINCQKVSGEENLWNLSVEEGRFAEAISILQDNGLPKAAHQSIGDVFKKSGMISSPSEERIRFIYALSEEVSKTISLIDGVLSARVHIVLPENDPFAENVMPSSAAVFIRYKPDYPIDGQVLRIKDMVSRSIEGLAFNKISVALFPAELSTKEQPGAKKLVSVMGMDVAQDSADKVRRMMTAVVVLALALAAAVGVLALKILNLRLGNLIQMIMMKLPLKPPNENSTGAT